MRKTIPFLVSTAIAALSASAVFAATGKVVLIGDEWPVSNTAFSQTSTETYAFIDNVAGFLGGSTYRIATGNPRFGSEFEDRLTGALGKTVSRVVDVSDLSGVDVVILAGREGSGNAAALNSFVRNGGSVFLALGTGEFRTAPAEVAGWRDFLSAWGLGAEGRWLPGTRLIAAPVSGGALAAGVTRMTWGYGHKVTADPANALSSIAVSADFGGGYGVTDIVAVYDGSDVVSNVPLPAGLPLLAAALGAFGLAARRR